MDALQELPMKLASGLIALALILMALKGPPSGPAPARANYKLSFPFMIAAPSASQRGHPYLRAAAKRYLRLASGESL